MWNAGSEGIARINVQVLEDVEDSIILKSFKEAKLNKAQIQKLIDENLETQRDRARMTQALEESKIVPDENTPVQKPVDITEEGKVEDSKRKFMDPLRPHEMIWNFFYDDEKMRPKHVLRPDAAPEKCYIDGRVQALDATIQSVAECMKTFTPDRWEKLNHHCLDIFIGQEKDESKAFEAWNATQQNN